MVSVRKIAKEAGVSPATVSRVLNSQDTVDPELRAAVMKIANEYRYVASGGKKDIMNLALVYLGAADAGKLLTSPFDVALIQGMAKLMGEKQYTLSILDATGARLPNESFSQMFHRRGIRGAVLRSLTDASRDECIEIAKEGFPSIVVAERFETPEVSWIDGNSMQASKMGVAKLIELGHMRIAFSSFEKDDQNHTDRYMGYLEAHENANLEVVPSYFIRFPAKRESGAPLLKRLLAMSPQPTAVFIADPMVAVGLLTEAQRTGVKIPDQLSVIGVDDGQIRYDTVPTLTSICQDTIQIGTRAAETLVSMIQTADRKIYQLETPIWLELHESIKAISP